MSEQYDRDNDIQAAYDRGYDRGYDAGLDDGLKERERSSGILFLDGHHLLIYRDGAYRIIDTRTGEDDGIRFTLPSTARGV